MARQHGLKIINSDTFCSYLNAHIKYSQQHNQSCASSMLLCDGMQYNRAAFRLASANIYRTPDPV